MEYFKQIKLKPYRLSKATSKWSQFAKGVIDWMSIVRK